MTAAAAEPKYISRLALQSNPFSAEVTEAGLYMGPEIKQRLDLVLHLLRASDKIPLLYGTNGLGKTTTLKALMNRGGDDLRFCLIQAEPSLTIQFMVSRCLQVFGAPQESTLGSNNLQLLQQRLQQLQTLQIRPVLLIDDISKLAEPLLQQIKAWFDWQHEGHYLWRAVVTDVTADAMVAQNERIQPLLLGPIPQQETAAYLLQRLQGVGFNGDSPFDDKALIRFHRQSSGVPAALNHLAHKFLLGQGKPVQLPLSFKFPAISLRWNKWFGLVPLGVLFALILFYQQQINDLFVADKNTIEDDVLNTDALTEDLPMVVVDEPEELTSVAEADRQELVELLEELEQADVEAEPTTDSAVEPEIETITPADEEESEPEPEPKQEVTAEVVFEPVEIIEQPSQPADSEESIADVGMVNDDLSSETEKMTSETADEEKVEPTSPPEQINPPVELIPEPATTTEKADTAFSELVDTTLKDKEWILQQSATDFTFQLMGTWDRAEVDNFVEKNELTGNVAVFESMRNGEVWYAVIYGVYPSKQVAMRDSQQWPSPLNKISAWLRRYDGVQKQIIDKAPDR
ncbi:AAA family ATPase [uncultured Methylophaga sp.]|jgi:DamX protein|uniref:SPOR domain-containing protein n=1 Tax=uncultured Methylophaga sp. TaxID=285271 RepID=UPI0030D9F329|tara:strand:+ start:6686 stop:8407 length:1722 start_codon:yes stop_codon:yes gene_type:complete